MSRMEKTDIEYKGNWWCVHHQGNHFYDAYREVRVGGMQPHTRRIRARGKAHYEIFDLWVKLRGVPREECL